MRAHSGWLAHPTPVWVAVVAIGLLMALFAGQSARAGESNVNFKGQLVEDPCTVAAGPDGGAVEVDFGSIPDKMLYLHKRTWTQKFHILLEECDLTLGSKVHLTFMGTEDNEQPGLLSVTGGAKHVAVGLLSYNGQAIELNKQTEDYQLHAGITELDFGAYVQASDSAIKAHNIDRGVFTAVATFRLEYI